MNLRRLALAAVTVASLVGAGLTSGQDGYREVTITNGATISGQATFAGSPPGPFVIWVKKNADVFGEKLPDERVIVSGNGKIKNVVVTLEGITEGKRWPDHRPQMLNKGGLFVPHLLVARTGAQLEVINQDPVLHNTHAYLNGKTLFNLAQPNRDQVIRRPLRRPGYVNVMCDSHDWMTAWITVLDHPYFAVTGEDGAWKITDVPPGTYTLSAWHEKLGRQQVRVTVTAKEQKQVKVTFSEK